MVKGVWRAVPQYRTFFVAPIGRSLQKAGLKIPDLGGPLHGRRAAEEDGAPDRNPISQNYDTISTASPCSSWGQEVEKDGKTVAINSAERSRCGVVQEDVPRLHGAGGAVLNDASNNESLQQGKAGWIHNPVSATSSPATQARDGRRTSTITAASPGHRERHETDVPRHIGIWKFSKNIAPARNGSAICSASARSTTSTSCRATPSPARVHEPRRPSRAQDRSEVRRAPGHQGRPVPLLRGPRRERQDPAHHQFVHPAQHDRQGGHRTSTKDAVAGARTR